MSLYPPTPCSTSLSASSFPVAMPKTLVPLAWDAPKLLLLDQTCLPEQTRWLSYTQSEAVAEAITSMVVRGAPAIGLAAAFAMIFAFNEAAAIHSMALPCLQLLKEKADALKASRPTAVNLMWAVDKQLALAETLQNEPVEAISNALEANALRLLAQDQADNWQMGLYGAALLQANSRLLTHCNAGALATGGYGTALAVVRAAYAQGKCLKVYADETRPRLQGARLTAYELVAEGIPTTLICDNMAASLMQKGEVDAIFVGADRIAANGDTANKIGTYSLAVVAKAHQVPFYVVAPLSTFDVSLPTGESIPIEERHDSEVTEIEGVRLAPKGVSVYNPAFDVTPAALITGMITPVGVLQPDYNSSIAQAFKASAAAV
jgi:methylthioribose-1-phosphate isomerase